MKSIITSMINKDWMHASKEEIENMTYQDMLEIMESHVGVFRRNPNDEFCNIRPHWMKTLEACIELLKEKLKEELPVTSKQKWIPLTWDESKCKSNYPDDMDGCWAIFTDGKNMSIERGKKDAFDHFFPSGRWFEMSDAIAWMPLPKWYTEGESEEG